MNNNKKQSDKISLYISMFYMTCFVIPGIVQYV